MPYIERRDEVSISVSRQATNALSRRNEQAQVQSETLRVCRENVDLTAELLELTEQVKRKKSARLDDPSTQNELKRLESELASSKQRRRVMKGVASGIVAGSGVDWARDEVLLDVVLDAEEED